MLARGWRVLALDQDPHTQRYLPPLTERYGGERFRFDRCNFRQFDDALRRAGVDSVSGLLLDLGVSSMQLDEAERGFAFRQDGPLDMRMAASRGLDVPLEQRSAADIVNEDSQSDIARILFKYGEERYSRRLAAAIVEARTTQPFSSTRQLMDVIRRAYPQKNSKDHPARRSFQALRIAVNDELGALEEVLGKLEHHLSPQAKLVVMSYHSLEDRIVKNFMRSSRNFKALYKKPRLASAEELERNPRARSAKLRVAEYLG